MGLPLALCLYMLESYFQPPLGLRINLGKPF